jgi:2-C-methyl-D-erythritol 4-phosphate cytidylyltransferase
MGSSKRPKQFLELGGRPIIDYTLAHFAEHPLISRIVVACLADWIDYLRDICDRRRYDVPIDIVRGGATGQESIFLGLSHLREGHAGDEDAIVLVHDGVRPLIDEKTITDCIDSVETRGATAVVAPATETIIVNGPDQTISSALERDACSLARAPQGCHTEDLFRAHVASREAHLEFIDSISMLAYYGHTIYTVEGPLENIKVTTPLDYYAFKGYMDARDQRMLWAD